MKKWYAHNSHTDLPLLYYPLILFLCSDPNKLRKQDTRDPCFYSIFASEKDVNETSGSSFACRSRLVVVAFAFKVW